MVTQFEPGKRYVFSSGLYQKHSNAVINKDIKWPDCLDGKEVITITHFSGEVIVKSKTYLIIPKWCRKAN